MKKILVIGIICLFIGVGIAPSITSIDISKNETSNSNDLVEITLQLCKTSGVEDHKMFITQEQYEQLDILIESFKADLDKAKTREETIEIYIDMVVSLDELGLLPESTNRKEVKELVTGEKSFNNPEKMKSIKHFNQTFEKLKNKNSGLDENTNLFCLISGETTNTVAVGPGTILSLIHGINLGTRFLILNGILETFNSSVLRSLAFYLIGLRSAFWLFMSLLLHLLPLKLGDFMIYGKTYWFPRMEPEYYPAKGWVYTIGLNGIKTWDDSLYGNILSIPIYLETFFLGATGFTGIKISPFSGFYFGFALRVKLSSNPS